MKEKSGFQIGTGVTSILMIFVILCLTTFGILSYTSVKADLTLTEKNADHVSAYYEAYSKAQERLSQIDNFLYGLVSDGMEDSGTYFNRIVEHYSTNGDGVIEALIPADGENVHITVTEQINDIQSLIMEVSVNDIESNQRYEVLKCYVYTENGGYSQEETLPDMWGE